MQHDEFVEIMKELVPPLVDQAIESASPSHGENKRARSELDSAEAEEPAPSRPRLSEALSAEECSDLCELLNKAPFNVFMSEYLKKKMEKELHHSNDPPELQAKIDEGKKTEWTTIVNKNNAVRLHYGRKAAQIRKEHADRFIGSRFVLTRKPLEEGGHVDPNDWSTFQVKGRWLVSPDTQRGMLKSPTLSQLGRMTLMQIISSMKWDLQLGDIRGAFLEAGPIDEKITSMYAHQPASHW